MLESRSMTITRRAVLGALTAGLAQADPAETLYQNGRIVTLDAQSRVLEAIGVRAGKIVPAAEVSRGARVVNLRGRTLLPGLYAAHDHFPQGGLAALYQVDLNSPPIGPVETMADLIRVLKERAARTPAGEWIVGRGYDDTLLREQRHPERRDLDEASSAHPIWIVHTSGHLGVANSRALAIAKIAKNSPAPSSGVIRRGPDGEPNGVIEENGGLVSRHIPAFTKEQRLKAIAHDDRVYLAKGVTTTSIMGVSPERVADLRASAERNEFHLNAVCYLSAGIPANFDTAAAMGGGRVRVAGVKYWQDGSLQGYTGNLTAPYYKTPEAKPDWHGYSNRSREELAASVLKQHRAGYQVAIHANGDLGIDEAIYAIREAVKAAPRKDARHRIEHCQAPRMDQLDTIRQLSITPSFFVGHVYYWGDRHRDIFLGPQRAAHISPLASAAKRGIPFTVHNDTPVTPVDPLLLVWCAVNRITREGKVLGPEERIPVEAALRSVTSSAAWQTFGERTSGSIEAGKSADLMVLEKDPLTIEPAQIKDIPVLETIVGGETVYRR